MVFTIGPELQYIDPERLVEEFQNLGSGMTVTHGFYELKCRTAVNDLDWNHMDPHHRPYIHRTYGNATRIACGRNFQLSLTNYASSPLFVVVTDVRLTPGLFYQCFSVFNLLFVISVIRAVPDGDGSQLRIDWYIVSRPFWSFMHRFLDRKMKRLNIVQNAEDAPIRRRRRELRETGFRFKSDEPDFLIASSLDCHTIPPELADVQHLRVENTNSTNPNTFKIENLEFLYFYENGNLSLWPAVCPHEGGPLCDGRLEGGGLVCPWHGLKFAPLQLTRQAREGVISGVRFSLSEGNLTAVPLGDE